MQNDVQIRFRAPNTHSEKLNALAGAMGCTVSEVLRQMVESAHLGEIRRQGVVSTLKKTSARGVAAPTGTSGN